MRDKEEMKYLQEKRLEILKAIKPICDAFGIKDYDYIVKETGIAETLRIYDTYIGCTFDSEFAVVNELIQFLVINRNIYLGRFAPQTSRTLSRNWLSEEEIARSDYLKSKKEITLTEFFESDKDLAIHCDTRQKAKTLLKAFDKMGKTWSGGCSYLKRDNYDDEESKTCYSNKGMYCSYEDYKDKNCTIYEFEEVDLDN